jgi:hypothetical protein
MKRIVTLLAVLAALIGVVVISQNKRDKRMGRGNTSSTKARELLLPGLDVNGIKKIRIKDSSGEVNLNASGEKWVVAERSDYPASFDKISRILLDLREQKVKSPIQMKKPVWGESTVKLLPPGEGDAAGQGLIVDFQDAKGNALKSFILGGNVSSQGGRSSASPFGGGPEERLVRIPEESEKDTVWVVGNSFYDLQPKPVEWIDKAFIDVEKLKDIVVTPPTAADSWSASRKDEQSPYSLGGAKAGEELDEGKAALAGLLSNPVFTDVLTKDQATPDFMKDAVKATIKTFDGFTYQVQAVKKGKDASDEKHYLTVNVTATLATERPPVKDEKEEDKKKADEAFAASKKTLEEKLAKEKKVEGWIYEVSGSTVATLLKKKSEVLKEAAAPATPAVGAPSATPPSAGNAATLPPPPPVSRPSTPISVTTPPVSVPPLPKTEIKPTPSPTENPAAPAAPTSPEPKAP